jgi:hypothetical protein
MPVSGVVVLSPDFFFDLEPQLPKVISAAGGEVVLGLGTLAAVVSGGDDLFTGLRDLVAQGELAGVVTVDAPELPVDVDEATALLVTAWLGSQDPGFLFAKRDPTLDGMSWDVLAGCGRGETG